jgi:menaquinone-dependent protoporphyrinogen oxidase
MKTLIIYATRYGSAERCAKMLSEKLIGDVDLLNLKDRQNIDLSQYEKVIIGGSIYVGKIQKEVNEFCTKHLEELKQKKVGLYVCGMLKEKADIEINDNFPQELLDHAIAREFFGGTFDFKKMNVFTKFIVKNITKNDKSLPEMDKNKVISTVSGELIHKFARSMNHA